MAQLRPNYTLDVILTFFFVLMGLDLNAIKLGHENESRKKPWKCIIALKISINM
jgi:hypothetical protein